MARQLLSDALALLVCDRSARENDRYAQISSSRASVGVSSVLATRLISKCESDPRLASRLLLFLGGCPPPASVAKLARHCWSSETSLRVRVRESLGCSPKEALIRS
jgi:hypothetical protein